MPPPMTIVSHARSCMAARVCVDLAPRGQVLSCRVTADESTFTAFRQVPLTGLIYVTSEAQKRGFTMTDPDRSRPGALPIASAARYVEDVDRDPVLIFDSFTKNWRYPAPPEPAITA